MGHKIKHIIYSRRRIFINTVKTTYNLELDFYQAFKPHGYINMEIQREVYN